MAATFNPKALKDILKWVPAVLEGLAHVSDWLSKRNSKATASSDTGAKIAGLESDMETLRQFEREQVTALEQAAQHMRSLSENVTAIHDAQEVGRARLVALEDRLAETEREIASLRQATEGLARTAHVLAWTAAAGLIAAAVAVGAALLT